jgi:hypothetical protein
MAHKVTTTCRDSHIEQLDLHQVSTYFAVSVRSTLLPLMDFKKGKGSLLC